MAFLNPAFLSALALVGVPLLIHLIRKRKVRVVKWAAMEFLRQSQKRQRRRLRIEELILLALRMLIVACAVLAFARPVLRALGVPLLSQNARVYAVLVLDNSFSMNARSERDGRSSWERGKAGVETILKQVLKPGDSASLVLLSDKPDIAVNAPSFDRNLLAARLRSMKLSDRPTDYLATAQTVNKLLKASKATTKEVYWLTDDQAGAWTTSKRDSAKTTWRDLGRMARVTWVSVGADASDRENLAVETPRLARELVTPHLPVPITARIVNYGARPSPALLVNLKVDGKPAGSTRVSVPAKGAAVARFVYLFGQAGTHVGEVSLGTGATGDSLAADNAAPFVARARDRIKILVQDARPTDDPTKSESFYLLTAMAPGGAAESLAPKLREGEGLGNVNLRDYDAVVLAGATRLSASDRRALAEYVRGGGGALIFPGPHTDARDLNAGLQASGLLPARLGTRQNLSDDDALTLNPGSITNPALALFKDTSSLNLSSARFTTYYPLAPLADAAAQNATQVMLRFSNGDPAFVERKVGLGKIILAASGASAAWNQLPLKASYVPLVYQLASYLGQGPTSHRNLGQDEPLFLSLPLKDANKAVRVTTPTGRVDTQNSVLDARGVSFTYAGTSQAGVYRVAVAGGATTDAFAVGLPADESDLSAVEPGPALAQVGMPAARLNVAKTPAQLTQTVRRARYGAEVWRPLVWLVIPLLFLESLLAQRFGRRG